MFIWAVTWQNQQSDCSPSEDSDHLGIRPVWSVFFSVRMKKAWVLSYPLSAHQRLTRLGGCSGWSESSLGAQFVGFVMLRLICSTVMILSLTRVYTVWTHYSMAKPPCLKFSVFWMSECFGSLQYSCSFKPAHVIMVLITKATSEGSGEPAHLRSLSRAFAVRTHEEWKSTKGPTKNLTSSPTGWLRMRVWRMSLWRKKSAIISWHGSFVVFLGVGLRTGTSGRQLLPEHNQQWQPYGPDVNPGTATAASTPAAISYSAVIHVVPTSWKSRLKTLWEPPHSFKDSGLSRRLAYSRIIVETYAVARTVIFSNS